MKENYTLDISWETILKIGIAALFFYLIFLVKQVLIWFLFALIISLLFAPLIEFLGRLKIPRILATLLIYLSLFFSLGLLIYLLALPIFEEIQKITTLFPQYFEKIAPPLKDLGIEAFKNFEAFTKNFQDWLLSASRGIFRAIAGIFGGILATFTIFTFAIFLSLEKNLPERVIKTIFSSEKAPQILTIWQECQKKVSGWFLIRLLGCLFVGILTFISLKALKIDYAFSLALLAGITNIIPILGPIFAGLIITILALLHSWTSAGFILVIFILIQQIEGNFLTPILGRKFLEMSPVLVLLSLLIGGKLWGILGAILAVPIFGIIFEFTKNLLIKKREIA